jgi:predicted small lipoprotein YifL
VTRRVQGSRRAEALTRRVRRSRGRRIASRGLAALLLLAALAGCGRYGPPVRSTPQTPTSVEAPAQPASDASDASDEDEEKKPQ